MRDGLAAPQVQCEEVTPFWVSFITNCDWTAFVVVASAFLTGYPSPLPMAIVVGVVM